MQPALEDGGALDRKCDNPQVAFFHLFFRTAALLTCAAACAARARAAILSPRMLLTVGARAAPCLRASPPARYIFCTWFSANFVMIFIVCVLLLALDFWTVKNVSGRLLVGLRWWNEIMPDGSSEWRFECADVRRASCARAAPRAAAGRSRYVTPTPAHALSSLRRCRSAESTLSLIHI